MDTRSRKTFSGVIAPVVTPFDAASGDLAADAFRGNLRAHFERGASGVLLCGSTGEAALLDESERDTLVEWARPIVPADRWLLAGVGGESTRLTTARARRAAERGADAVLVVAPHYYGTAMTPDVLGAHYRAVADASPVPVLLYNIPKYMHFPLDVGLVRDLAAHPNIVGIKDSSGDLELLRGYLASQSDTFAVLTGNGGTFLTALESGAAGGILAVSLLAGELSVAVWQAFHAGDRARATALQLQLTPLSNEIVGGMGVPGVKAAMDQVGRGLT
ncbi:MAG: dihydrodipicolinate synthase family protein, partial [Gemmatimonadaceae bacterium]